MPLQVVHGRLLLAPVEISGTTGWFFLDTGSEGTIVCPALGASLPPAGEPGQISRFGAEDRPLPVARVKSGGIRFAGNRLAYPEEVSVVDLGFLTEWAGTRVDGILGWDALQEYVWGIDVRGGMLVAGRRCPPEKILGSFGASGAEVVLPCEIIGGRPHLTARVGNDSLRLVLDTAARRTVLSAAAARRLGVQVLAGAAPIVSRGVNGSVSGSPARLEELRLGPVVWTELEVLVREAANAGEEQGLLGMDLLEQCLMVVDGPSRTVHLTRHAPGR